MNAFDKFQLTLRDICLILNVSSKTIQRAIQAKIITPSLARSAKNQPEYRFTEEDVITYLNYKNKNKIEKRFGFIDFDDKNVSVIKRKLAYFEYAKNNGNSEEQAEKMAHNKFEKEINELQKKK